MNTFTIPANVAAQLPDYSELDYNLPTLKDVLNSTCFSADEDDVEQAIDTLSAEGKAALDNTMIGVCGWSRSTLCEMAEKQSAYWLDLFFDEMENDEENPYKETGRQIFDWQALPESVRTEVDAVYKAMFNITMTTALTRIIDAITDQLPQE